LLGGEYYLYHPELYANLSSASERDIPSRSRDACYTRILKKVLRAKTGLVSSREICRNGRDPWSFLPATGVCLKKTNGIVKKYFLPIYQRNV
jgi:hypothetical protein